MEKRKDYEYIKKAMLYVKENHTFVNRIEALMKIV